MSMEDEFDVRKDLLEAESEGEREATEMDPALLEFNLNNNANEAQHFLTRDRSRIQQLQKELNTDVEGSFKRVEEQKPLHPGAQQALKALRQNQSEMKKKKPWLKRLLGL